MSFKSSKERNQEKKYETFVSLERATVHLQMIIKLGNKEIQICLTKNQQSYNKIFLLFLSKNIFKIAQTQTKK